ncbi:hypothetical protein BRC93_03825 [Halobacteriales archaeon QS_5_70_15]|nr:MAG: hypothetical protein BRC93_03825 [Halobacteriales archaeon QS_5_70_15]
MLELDGAAFELFETDEGRWRWRLVDDGTALATTPRRFETEGDAEADVEAVRELTGEARLLDLEEGGFEIREDDGAWRWRFVTPRTRRWSRAPTGSSPARPRRRTPNW